jgi:RNA polymerase sigma factor (sigma-70 family)
MNDADRQRLVEKHRPLVFWVFNRYAPKWKLGPEDREDLEGAIQLGIVEATTTWRPGQGSFMTHAVWTARRHLNRAVSEMLRGGMRRCPGGRRPSVVSIDQAGQDRRPIASLIPDRSADRSDTISVEWSSVIARMSPRERAVLRMRRRGVPLYGIQQRLGISRHALRSINQKVASLVLAAASTAEAVAC